MQTEAALAAFDETKALQSLAKENSEISQSAMSVYNKSFNKMADMSVSLLARSIQKIVTPDGEQENNPTEILNFLQNIDSKAAKQIDEKLAEINALNIEKKCEIECQNESCKHVWTTELDINPTDFFVAGS